MSNFQISGQSFINQNCPNSKTSNDIDMKVGPVTKPEKKKHGNGKKIDDDFMSGNSDVVVIFSIYG